LKRGSRFYIRYKSYEKFRWQLIIIFLTGLIVGILLLLERGGGGNPLSSTQPTTGGVYTEALIGQFKRLNPLLDQSNQADRDVDRLIFSGLIKFDSRGLPVPDLADSWNVSGDGKIYNVTLKKDLKWHDGKPLTAGDVVFTVGLMSKGGDYIPADLKTFWEAIKVVALDDTHLQFVLPEAYSPFLDYMGLAYCLNISWGACQWMKLPVPRSTFIRWEAVHIN